MPKLQTTMLADLIAAAARQTMRRRRAWPVATGDHYHQCAAAMQAGPDEVGLASGLLNTSQQFGHDVSERLRPASFSWVAVEADTTPALCRRQVASVFTKRINRCGGHGPQSELNGST